MRGERKEESRKKKGESRHKEDISGMAVKGIIMVELELCQKKRKEEL